MQQTDPWRRPQRAAPPEAVPRVVLYAVGQAVTAHCVAATKGREIALVTVKHLQQACATLKEAPATMVVVSTTVKWWDRAVIEDHARQASIAVRYVAEDDDEVGEDILSAVETERLRRLELSTGPSAPASKARAVVARPPLGR